MNNFEKLLNEVVKPKSVTYGELKLSPMKQSKHGDDVMDMDVSYKGKVIGQIGDTSGAGYDFKPAGKDWQGKTFDGAKAKQKAAEALLKFIGQ